MELVRLLPSGIQTGNQNVLAASESHCAYCSTLGVYILRSVDMFLESVISMSKKPYNACAWSAEVSLFVTVTSAGELFITDVQGSLISELKIEINPTHVDWPNGKIIIIAHANGDVVSWIVGAEKASSPMYNAGMNNISSVKGHHSVDHMWLIGCKDGTCILLDTTGHTKPLRIQSVNGKAAKSVVDARWDPLSVDYFLCCWADGSLGLFDTTGVARIWFSTGSAVTAIRWVKSQPGSFLVLPQNRPGVIQLWNASKASSPLEQIRVASSPIASMDTFPKSAKLVFSLENGAVGAFDLVTKRELWLTAAGHSDTVFDCCFGSDPDHLFTAGYDGRVKLWALQSGQVIREFSAGSGVVLYSVSVSGDLLAASAATGFIYCWSVQSGQLIWWKKCHDQSVLRLQWSDSGDLIASGGADSVMNIRTASKGDLVSSASHPSQVVGVVWKSASEVLSACHDAKIRLWRVDRMKAELLKTFTGHADRVFNLAINPINAKLFASTSDDQTVAVWNFDDDGAVATLKGHTAPVRGLAWHCELPTVLFSGSWDCKIIVWDYQREEVLAKVVQHKADIYGIACHPLVPFRVVSCSRDSTIRVWSCLRVLTDSLMTQIITAEDPGRALALSLASQDDPVDRPFVKLWGLGSRRLAGDLTQTNQVAETMEKLCDFFRWKGGMSDLWKAVRNAVGDPEKNMLGEEISRSNESASESQVHRGVIGGASPAKRQENLRHAAQSLARAGDLSGACEVFIAAGDWLQALAIAPGVSLDFWHRLAGRYCDAQKGSDPFEAWAPVLQACGRGEQLASEYVDRREYSHAVVAILGSGLTGEVRDDAIKRLVRMHVESGQPLKAAETLLGFSGRVKEAAAVLTEAGESEIATAVLRVLGNN